jgi:hypothetical protein
VAVSYGGNVLAISCAGLPATRGGAGPVGRRPDRTGVSYIAVFGGSRKVESPLVRGRALKYRT